MNFYFPLMKGKKCSFLRLVDLRAKTFSLIEPLFNWYRTVLHFYCLFISASICLLSSFVASLTVVISLRPISMFNAIYSFYVQIVVPIKS